MNHNTSSIPKTSKMGKVEAAGTLFERKQGWENTQWDMLSYATKACPERRYIDNAKEWHDGQSNR